MGRSLRWSLLGWQALILLAVVAGFGTVLYWVSRKARFDEIDAELLAAGRILEGGLRALPRNVLDGGPGPPLRPEGPLRPPPWSREEGPGRRGPPPALDFPAPPELLDRTMNLPRIFREKNAGAEVPPYYVIWRRDSTVLRSSLTTEDAAFPPMPDTPLTPDDPYLIRQRGMQREVLLKGPERTLIIVGRSIEIEMAELHQLGWEIAGIGFGVFVLGLAGGWWLAGRAVRPIRKMSATAATIGASNLSRRIDLADVNQELAELGQILNAMLGRLESAFAQQIRFTADASHELRTPLAVIMSHTELALARQRSPEEYRQALATCQRAAQRMRSLVESLLALARLDAAELRMNHQPLDLGQLASECAEHVRPLAVEHGLRLEVKTASVSLLGDAERLAQVVTNLLTNAIIYNRPKGSITLVVEDPHGEAILSVSDTGIGIPEADLPHIFERFYRADKARSRAVGGSGLGLAICQSIIEAHGGTIQVSSELGVGTTFLVKLPQARGVEDLTSKSRKQKRAGRETPGKG
jgi:heavy metal sensor kinase